MLESKILVEEWGKGLWLVVLAGEHDLSTAPQLEQTLAEIERSGTDLIMDFSEATFIDSTTLREILRHAEKPSEAVALVAPPGTPPRRLFDLVMPDRSRIPVCDTREDALRALGR
jgi:ABC-type transporter Mla MlaB component